MPTTRVVPWRSALRQVLDGIRPASRVLVGLVGLVGLAGTLGGCADAPAAVPGTSQGPAPRVAVAGMKGPTGMGLAKLMDAAASPVPGASVVFDVTLYGSADAITPKLVDGSVPIATVPVNLASVLYAKTGGQVQLAAVNTLGVLHVVAKGPAASSVHSVADLAGLTVWSTGKGTTPEYVLNHLLAKAGVADQVKVEYLSEASEVASRLVAADSGVAVLPEPYVTTVTAKDPSVVPVLDLTQAWTDSGAATQLVTGALVVNKSWAAAHGPQFAAFLSAYEASIKFAVDDPSAAGALIAKAGIVPDAGVATTAIPRCHLVYLTGDQARTAVLGYLEVLHAANPASVGGTLPDDGFFWAG